MNEPIRVLQVSDLHFGVTGLFGRDPYETFASVRSDIAQRGLEPDVVVATGDLTHDGGADPSEALALVGELGPRVLVTPGNHDAHDALASALAPPVVDLDHGWSFVFVDTNRAGREPDATGRLVDRTDRGMAAATGLVDDEDVAALTAALRACAERRVMVWMHHPPVSPPSLDLTPRTALGEQLLPLLSASAAVRSVAFGHLHGSFSITLDGVNLECCPSTWLALDFASRTIAPPGYRWHELHADGTVRSSTHWVRDREYHDAPPMPDWVLTHLAGL